MAVIEKIITHYRQMYVNSPGYNSHNSPTVNGPYCQVGQV